ncbi:hypothetical protein CD928_16560 [Sphingopyxis sp. GW247-27LB]|nr:hypothetical protein CD928_16560 [Sphingopyxis sp. GW247-27LB]
MIGLSVMTFDAPGSEKALLNWMGVFAVWIMPFAAVKSFLVLKQASQPIAFATWSEAVLLILIPPSLLIAVFWLANR